MSNELTTWDDVRRLADQIELQIHLGSMETRDRWKTLKVRVENLETRLVHLEEHITDAIERELADLRAAMTKVRDDLVLRARGDFVAGW